jgi:protein dithiol oxidoreductase (disulfide-forming)
MRRMYTTGICRFVLALLLLPALSASAQVERYLEGQHYRKLPESAAQRQLSAVEGKVPVLEVFWYGCGSCAAFDPQLNAWVAANAATISFSRSPAIWNDSTRSHARLFFAARELGIGSQIHEPAFHAIHSEGATLLDDGEVIALFVAHGADVTKAQAALGSFAVDSALRKEEALQRELQISGVPVLLVNGRYLVKGPNVRSYEDMLAVAEFLVAREAKK